MRAVNLLPRDEQPRSFAANRGVAFGAGGGVALVSVALAALMIGAGGAIQQQSAERDSLNAQLAALPPAPVDQQESSDERRARVREESAHHRPLVGAVDPGRLGSRPEPDLPGAAGGRLARRASRASPATADASAATGAVGPPGASVTLIGSTYSQRGVARFLARLGVAPGAQQRSAAVELDPGDGAERHRPVHDPGDRQGSRSVRSEAEALTPRTLRRRDRRSARLRARLLVRAREPEAGRGVCAQGRGCRAADHGRERSPRRHASEQRGHAADRGRGHLPAGEGDALRPGHAGHPARALADRRGDRDRVPVGDAGSRPRSSAASRPCRSRSPSTATSTSSRTSSSGCGRWSAFVAGELRAAGRLFAVESISFAESPKGFPELGATLSVVAYVYGTDVPASTGTPPAATTPPADPNAAAPAADPNAATPAPAPAATPTGAEASP